MTMNQTNLNMFYDLLIALLSLYIPVMIFQEQFWQYTTSNSKVCLFMYCQFFFSFFSFYRLMISCVDRLY